LDDVFSSPANCALLRALLNTREGMSGRAAARAAGINHQVGSLSIGRLEAAGVIERRGAGRVQLVRLRPDNVLVDELLRPLFRGERALWTRLREELSKGWGKGLLSVVLFGSAARGEAGPDSDVDLLVLVEGSKVSVRKAADERRSSVLRRYGFRLSPLVFNVDEVRKRLHSGDRLLSNILREGILLGGRSLKEVIR
jgi:predicted nucleotidyltransferase